MELQVEETKLQLHLGDITELKVDAIVNAANDRLWMGGGVAGAIKRKGGQVIEDEAVRQGPIPVGEAVVTTAGNLRAKYVIHAAVMGQDRKTDEAKIREATRNSLRRAEEQGVESIAFPAFGTGVGGLSVSLAAQAMIDEVIAYLGTPSQLRQVVFALFGQEAYQAFEEELGGRGG